MATTSVARSSLGPSLPPPSPKSPPKYPDLHGKRREVARVHMLEKEISVLQDQLKFTEGLQPASTCCKELIDFVVANADPLLPTNKKKRRLYRRFWKWLCRMPNWKLHWICCYCCEGCKCNIHLKLPQGCCKSCKLCNCTCLPSPCCCGNICALPKWRCFSCPKSECCKNRRCCRCQKCCIIPRCCKFDCPSGPSCCTCKCSCSCSCPSCPVVSPCCCFVSRSCWKNCYCACTCPKMTVC